MVHIFVHTPRLITTASSCLSLLSQLLLLDQSMMRRKSKCNHCLFRALLIGMAVPCNAFLPIASRSRGSNLFPNGFLSYSKNGNDIPASDSDFLKDRLQRIRLEVVEEELRRPPNPNYTAKQLIEEIMNGLLQPYDPLPDSGFRMMLRTATKEWREAILQSIGAKDDADLELAASALGVAMERLPNKNQFAILVGEGEDYILDFPAINTVDYEDGTCWIECRLREKATKKLLVITGWSLRQREDDGAWLVDSIDWQDFRDEFWPGIGREEWMEKSV